MLVLGSTVALVALPLWLGRHLAKRELENERRALAEADREALMMMSGLRAEKI